MQSEDVSRLQRALEALQAAAPELSDTCAVVLLATREFHDSGRGKGVNTTLIAQRLDIEHAMVRRAATELETGGYITSIPVGGASPALRLKPV